VKSWGLARPWPDRKLATTMSMRGSVRQPSRSALRIGKCHAKDRCVVVPTLAAGRTLARQPPASACCPEDPPRSLLWRPTAETHDVRLLGQLTSASERVERAGPSERHARPDRLLPSIDQRTGRIGTTGTIATSRHRHDGVPVPPSGSGQGAPQLEAARASPAPYPARRINFSMGVGNRV
jgi:hypothetical protein